MTSAYGSADVGTDSTGTSYAHLLPYIPLDTQASDDLTIRIDFIRSPDDVRSVHRLLNDRIAEGESWPFDHPLTDPQFRNYYFAHTALLARAPDGQVVASFYCKPNFPGRCAHVCNGGFITDPAWRGRGIGTAMARVYLRVARDLGFRSVLFNLVFARNAASIRIWEKLGFRRLATLPRVAFLASGVSDAYQYHYDLEESSPHVEAVAEKRELGAWHTVWLNAAQRRLPALCAGVICVMAAWSTTSRARGGG